MIDRVTVVKFRMDNGGGNGAGCFEVRICADTAVTTAELLALEEFQCWGSDPSPKILGPIGAMS